MNIQISGEHIANGVRKSPMKCPIALSFMDAMECDYAVVAYAGDKVSIRKSDAWQRFVPEKPHRFRTFIRAFDRGANMKGYEGISLSFTEDIRIGD